MELHREVVAGDAPVRWMVLTHGIYGSGANLRGIARKVVGRRPEWGIALVDLRGHGRSPDGEPPHDLESWARDLHETARAIGASVVGGHSLGGKLALVARGLAGSELEQTWILDASPSARPGATADPDNLVPRVLAILRALPRRWPSREAFVAALASDASVAALGQWLAMSLVRDGETYVLRFDLDALASVLADYYAHDAWEALLAPAPGSVEVVLADRSSTVSPADRARLASAPAHVHVHHVDAGHWLHVDAPGAVVDLLVARLPAATSVT